jgi:hypothetical protein
MTPTAKGPHDIACDLAQQYASPHDLNEADTRHRVIDTVLHDVLSWPRSAVSCESYIHPGYADYVLIGRQDMRLIFIEAKKEGTSFTLPTPFDTTIHARVAKMKTLITDTNIRDAVEQVWTYCISCGCEYAAVTNGHQWIFFKTFERQRDWRDLNAFAIHSLRYFCDCFSEATNKFGYVSIVEHASLAQLSGVIQAGQRDIFYPKAKITAYAHKVDSNYLAPFLRPLVKRYFGVMDEHDDEFMEKCYVNARDYHASVAGVKGVIHDCLSPYFINYNVKEFFDDPQGGAFGRRIASNLRERRTREVIILFGGKGSGKSTFIRRLLYHRPPEFIRDFAVVVLIDLLECPEHRTHIENETWRQLLSNVDRDHLLEGDREHLLDLFADKHRQAEKQSLVGLDKTSEAYNTQLNAHVQTWLDDREYCAVKLADHWKRMQKGLIIVLDNTDQFTPGMQDYCFTLAQHISTLLDCLVVISMREERFHYSKLHGTLDAFQNSGFHLSSPPTQTVFWTRLRYMLDILDDEGRAQKISPALNDIKALDIKKLLRVLLGDFARRSHLNQFLMACAHGNMRLSLELFCQFLLSGYTRVDEMIKSSGWTLQIHQVLRPMMVPERFFYDEISSSIPNLYQIRSEISGSHFTALRILTRLSANMSRANPIYVPLSLLKSHFASNFNMIDDLVKNLDLLLHTGLIESNNRVDEYSDSIDSLKITSYGYYMVHRLCYMFNYIDLVCLDCGIHDQSVAHSLALLAERDMELFFKFRKKDRIEVRLQRAQEFIDYIVKEEEIEREMYSLEGGEVRYSIALRESFDREKPRVIASAKRNYG